MGRIHEYESEEITVRYDVKRCIHAKECVRGLPLVFDPERRPWIEPERASADEIAAVVARCPTGALAYVRRDGGAAESPRAEPLVSVIANGPLEVSGAIELALEGEDGSRSEYRAALCRCGKSANKPFCDNSHEGCGFEDTGEVDASRGAAKGGEGGAAESRAGALRITPNPNGPLILDGPAEIRSADESTAVFLTGTALCRCGGSHDKPFCDGTHTSIGFQSSS